MTDNPDSNKQVSSSTQTENSEHMIPKSRFDDVNNRYKETLARLEALEQESQSRQAETEKARQKELAEQNRYKELYEQTLSQLESLKTVQDEAKRYRESFESILQSRLDQIPDEKKHLVPEYDDPIKLNAWLDEALPDLTAPRKPTAPRLDGGSGSGMQQRSGVTLTQDEITFATSAGIPLDEYQRAKAQRGQPFDLNKRSE